MFVRLVIHLDPLTFLPLKIRKPCRGVEQDVQKEGRAIWLPYVTVM